MDTPAQILFHNLDHSPAIEDFARKRIEKLERFWDRITRCRVTIEAPHQQHTKGNKFKVRIDVTVPGKELIVDKDPGDTNAHEDVYVAMRDAFEAAERQLKSYSETRRNG